jgi:hypothetical protein
LPHDNKKVEFLLDTFKKIAPVAKAVDVELFRPTNLF